MRLLGLGILGAALLLTGCAAGPSQEAIEKRFAIEAAGVFDQEADDPAIIELAEGLAENADEDCLDADVWRIATSPLSDAQWDANLQYIHAAACSTLYGDSIDPALADEYKRVILARVVDVVDE